MTLSIIDLIPQRRALLRPYEGTSTASLERKLKTDAIKASERDLIRREMDLREALKPKKV